MKKRTTYAVFTTTEAEAADINRFIDAVRDVLEPIGAVISGTLNIDWVSKAATVCIKAKGHPIVDMTELNAHRAQIRAAIPEWIDHVHFEFEDGNSLRVPK